KRRVRQSRYSHSGTRNQIRSRVHGLEAFALAVCGQHSFFFCGHFHSSHKTVFLSAIKELTSRREICLGGTDNVKHENEIDLFEAIDENESKHKRTDRSVLCYLRKAQPGKAWPRLTKEKAKLSWLSVDFNNWKDWEDDSDEEMGNFDQFSDMMNNMGGEDDLPDLDGADDDESADSDDEKMPDLE
uniref:Prostaglandin E synthase 3 n=1 Tax=Amphiprion percula TaxID=161767 RepID=A0A3P8T0S5_AMPPE